VLKRDSVPLTNASPSPLKERDIKRELEGRSPSPKILPLPLIKGKGTKACPPHEASAGGG